MSRLLKITDLGSGIMVQGTDNVLFPDNATLTYPYNSIVVVTDESDMVTFRSASNNDVLFSGLIGKIEIGGEIVTKQNINTKFDAIANQESGGGGDVTGLFADASYDSQTKHINFYDKDNTLVAYVDTTDFIKDGMVSNVEILNGNLVITFNTDAGKEPITIPLTDIFNPNNYYTKTDANALFATQIVVNEEIAARIQGDSDINTTLGTKADKSDTYTKTQVDDALALKQDASTAFSGNYNDLSNKPDLSIYAESSNLANVATSGSYNDLSNKPDLTVYATKADMDIKEEVISTALNDLEANKQDTLTAGTNITIQNNVISATGGTQVQSDWNQSDSTAVDYIKNKPTIPDVSDYVEKSVFNNKELAVANALVLLNTNKLDASAAFSGNYNDLTNKPTIPDAVSGTNDGTNWTTITIGSTTKAIPSGGGGGGNYVQYDSGNQDPVMTISRMNRLEYEDLLYKDDNTLYIVTPIEWKVLDDYDYQFGDGNPTDLFAQTLPAQQIAMNEHPNVTLYEDLDMGSSPIQGSWSYDSSEYTGTLTWTDSDGGSCSMVIEFSVIGGSDIVIDDASKITYTNPNNHCYTVEWS